MIIVILMVAVGVILGAIRWRNQHQNNTHSFDKRTGTLLPVRTEKTDTTHYAPRLQPRRRRPW